MQEERWRLTYGIPVRARGLSLTDYLQQWLDVARTRLRPNTFDSYELCVRRIELSLGRVPVAKLTPQMVQRAYADLLAGGLSARTVFQTHAVLRAALKQARHWGLIVGNPIDLVAASTTAAARDEGALGCPADGAAHEQPE
jgi:hypothetical protein